MADSKTKAGTKETKRFYKLNLIRYRIKHGLVLHSLLNLLLRFGISINPYWIDEEGLHLCKEPKIRNDDQGLYRTGPVEKNTILELYQNIGWNTAELQYRLEHDYHAVGLYRKDAMTAFMMMRYQGFAFRGNHIELTQQEAYLDNMYTYEDYRGRNLAPYLRYQGYEKLAEKGKTRCYSITQYFNTSSQKFKAKLGAKHAELWLHIGLFGKFKRNFLLKKYTA